jgi:hypothetical protein
MGLTSATVVAPTPVLASAKAPSSVTGPCSDVASWDINLGYDLVKINGSWVLSFNGTAAQAFASVSLSVSGRSFSAVARYYSHPPSPEPGYVASYRATLDTDCSIGPTNPFTSPPPGEDAPGTWTATGRAGNHQSGQFTATASFNPVTYDVAGKVTGPGGVPVPGVVIEARIGQEIVGKSATDGNGHYEISGLAQGRYSIGPATDQQYFSPDPGMVSLAQVNPLKAVVAVLNFTESCGAGKPGQPACPLAVSVKVLEPLRSGLAEHGKRYNEFPVDFVNSPAQGVFRCESGCADVVLTVVDGGTHKPVPGATVSVSVNNLAGLGRVAGDQYLCPESTDGRSGNKCSNYLHGLTPDGNGQVYVRYWAPGVDLADATTLTATATCSVPSCPHGQPSGSASAKLTVSPYLIYNYTAPLSEEDATELAGWAGGTAIFTKFLHTSVAAPKVLWAALKWLEANETAVEVSVKGLEALEKVEPVFGVLEVFQAFTELWERESMISMFLQDTGLNAVGLGGPAVEASAHAAPSSAFATHLVNYGVVVPFNLGADGAWWDIATTLRKLQASDEAKGKQPDLSNWKIRLKVYEVSSCDPSKGDCAPGYINEPGQADPLRPGIQPELEISVSLLDNEFNRAHTQRELYDFGTYTFTVPYDAIAWNEAQDNRNLLIDDFK